MGIKIGTGGLSVEWIIRATGGELYTVTGRGCAAGCGQLGTAETAERRGISTDTRTLEAGEIYLALAGERFDGHRFIPAAFERGASAVNLFGFAGGCSGGHVYSHRGQRTGASRYCARL